MRSLGLDIGERRIGVALSDTQGILASPFTIVDRKEDDKDIAVILDIIDERQVGQVIIGLPYSMNGSISQQAERVKAFTERLCGQTEIPIEFRDERLSTISARRMMREAARKKSRKKVNDDAIAAAVILQGFLDEKRQSL